MIFIDSDAFLARYLGKDQHHRPAQQGWQNIRKTRLLCFTSNFVLNETFTLLARRAGYSFAAERARNILTSPILTILRPHSEDESEAVDLFEKFADQQVSFTDCISFALMRKHKIRSAFSFDSHFEAAGFRLWH